MNLKANFKRNFSVACLKLRKHAPEIMVVLGCAGTVGAAVLACKETLELEEVLDNSKEMINDIKNSHATTEEELYPEAVYKKDLASAYFKAGFDIVKLYSPSVLLGGSSIALIFASNNMMKKRNASLAAAYATLDSMYKRYRKNVIEAYGEDVDRDMRFGIKREEIVEEVIDEETGKKKTVKKTVEKVENPGGYSDYARFFDESCRAWDKEPEYNLMFLKGVQSWANNKLQAYGYLFLNDVYDALGIPRTLAGQSVGWVYDSENPVGDNFVDFGIYDKEHEAARCFVNGTENVILLDFNVDGDILHDERLKMYVH